MAGEGHTNTRESGPTARLRRVVPDASVIIAGAYDIAGMQQNLAESRRESRRLPARVIGPGALIAAGSAGGGLLRTL